jgi:HAD superfamily hydrolase (TIGR01509 family)
MMLKGLIFDFDGLILDTELPAFQAWQGVYQKYGQTLPIEKWVNCIGTSPDRFDAFDYLQALVHSPLPREHILAARRKVESDLISRQAVMPGVVNLLKSAHENGVNLAVASSSPLNWVSTHLQRLGICNQFDCLVTAEDVERVKPAPDLFNIAVDRLHATPDSVVVFEDSLNGILAAQNAGIYCVAVPNEVTSHLDLSSANWVAHSLTEISLDALDDALRVRA